MEQDKDAIEAVQSRCSSPTEAAIWSKLKNAVILKDLPAKERALIELETFLNAEMVEMCIARAAHYEKRAVVAKICHDLMNVALFLGKADQVAVFDPNAQRRFDIKKAYRESESSDPGVKRQILVSLSCPTMAEQCCLREWPNDFELGPGWSL